MCMCSTHCVTRNIAIGKIIAFHGQAIVSSLANGKFLLWLNKIIQI